MDPKNWNFEVDDEEDEYSAKETNFTKDCTIFAVDCSEPMFLVKTEDGLTHFEMSMKAALNFYCQKCCTSDRDYLGVIFYNTDQTKNSHSFDHIYAFHEVALPCAERVKEIEALLSGDVRKNFKEKFGHTDCNLDEVFWMAGTMFSNTGFREGSKRLYLFTNCDKPHKNDPDRQRRVQQKIQDLKEQQVSIEVLPIGREDFCWDDFYSNALGFDDASAKPCPADRLDELLDRTLRKNHRKRVFASLPFDLGGNVEFAVSIYTLIAAAKAPTPTRLYRKTNEEVKSAQTFLDVETGEKLLPVDLKKFQTYGGVKIAMEPEEADRMRRLVDPGMVLIGFKPKNAVNILYHIRPGLFMYPNEFLVKGGSQLFRTLLERCAAKDVVPICRLTIRNNMAPKLVALMPQVETFDSKGSQEDPPGFHVVFLPFAEDVRDLSKVVNELRPAADSEQVGKAKEIVDKLTVAYHPDSITNPSLQKHFKTIEAFALDRENVEDVPDLTKPNTDWIIRKAGQTIQEFKSLVYPDDYAPGGPKKRGGGGGGVVAAKKAKVDGQAINLEEETKNDRLEKLTVANLRELSSTNGIKLTATRKADIVQQIKTHYGF